MIRADLTDYEISRLLREISNLPAAQIDQIRRLCGEVRRLREQDSARHHLAGIEGAY